MARTNPKKTVKKPARRGRPPTRRRAAESDESRYAGSRVIKKYGNRRLYDAKLRRAVTATEVAEMVRKGEDLRVVDADSGSDITRRFLVQIILEEQNAQQLELLPVELLRLIIGARSSTYGSWMGSYLEAGAEWIKRQVEGTSHLGGMVELWPWKDLYTAANRATPPTPHDSPSASSTAAPSSKARASSKAKAKAKAGSRREPAAGEELRAEMDELTRRLADLASKVGRG